jgi:hypothetical protein
VSFSRDACPCRATCRPSGHGSLQVRPIVSAPSAFERTYGRRGGWTPGSPRLDSVVKEPAPRHQRSARLPEAGSYTDGHEKRQASKSDLGKIPAGDFRKRAEAGFARLPEVISTFNGGGSSRSWGS